MKWFVGAGNYRETIDTKEHEKVNAKTQNIFKVIKGICSYQKYL